MTTSTPASRSRIDWRGGDVPRPLRWTLLGFLALVAFSRSPYVLLRGRFWGEEGALHFAHMYDSSFPGELFYVQTRTGYYNLFANLSTWVASNAPLLYAPLVTAWMSFGVIAVLLWVALAWPSELLTTAAVKVAAAVLLLVGTLANAEVWLNTINAQTYLGLLTLLVLFVRVDELSTTRYVIGAGLLFVAGLSGLYSVALVPLFVVCALLDRSWRRWGHTLTLAAAAVIQAAVVLTSRSSGDVAESKMEIPQLGEAFRSLAGWHLGAMALGKRIGRAVDNAGDGSVVWMLVVGAIGVVLAGLLVVLLWRAPSRRVTLLLVSALVLVEVLVQVGGLGGEAIGRYTVVPIGILTLMLLYGVAGSWGTDPPWQRLAAWAGASVLTLALLVGLTEFWRVQPRYLRCIDCPEWADEVDQYDETGKPPEIWPYDRDQPWIISLPPP